MRKKKNSKNNWPKRETLAYDTCEMKTDYDSKEDADQKGMRSYQCPFCGKWHKTSLKNRGKYRGK